jgi:hypothetical protein
VPVLDGDVEALAVAPDGQSVFIGGSFNHVNGTTRRKVALVNVANGQLVTSFSANAGAKVLDLAVLGNRLFMAGVFDTVKGQPFQALAAVDVATGTPDPGVNFTFSNPWKGPARVLKIDLAPDGSRLVAIGNFRVVSGLDRQQIVMFDLTSSPVVISNWQTNQFPQVQATGASWCSASFDTYMRDVAFSPDGSFFVVGTTGAFRGGRMCDTASRWETSSAGIDLMPTWVDWSGGDTTTAVVVTERAVYVGGHQRWWNNPYRGDSAGPGAVPRDGIAALDPANGLPFTWNPIRDPRGVGVFALLATPDGLWVGSDTDNIGSEFHGKLAFMPVDGGTIVPQIETVGLPNDLVDLETGGAMVRRPYDGTTFGPRQTVSTGINWGSARGAFVLNDALYYGWSDGRLYRRSFDGTSVGPQVAIDLHGLEVQPPTGFFIPGTTTRVPALTTHIAGASGMFYDQGRLYYTVRNEPRLYYRSFTLESEIVGANLYVASTSGVDWGQVSGMSLADGFLYFGATNGSLSRIAFANGQISGSPQVVGGPAIDGYNWNVRGLFLSGDGSGGGDTTPPTQPGRPAGVATSSSTIDLTWAASTDDQSSQITYRVYRDGGASSVGTVVSSSTTTVAFTDTGLAAGSTHTYRVDAQDEALNTSLLSSASDPITTFSGGGAIFSDDFASGTFGSWTAVTNLSIDNSIGGVAPPSARGTPSNQAAFARRDLGGTFSSVCLSEAVTLSQTGDAVILMRLRSDSGGPIARVFVTGPGVLTVRSDFAGTQRSSGTTLPAGWNTVELCGTVGSAGAWSLFLNGTPILEGWVADTGTSPVGRIEIGDAGSKSWTGNFDDVVLDTTPG